MHASRHLRLAVLLLTTFALAFAAPSAFATVAHKYQAQITEAGGKPLGAPWGLAFDGEGDLLVADAENGTIDRFDQSNAFLAPQVEGGQFFPPYRRGVAVSTVTGDLYVAESGFEDVDVFKPEGAGKYSLLEEHSFSGYVYAAVDNSSNPLDARKGDIYALNGLRSVALHVFEPGAEGRLGAQVEEKEGFSITKAGKAGLSVDPTTGDVYVADPGHHAVDVFSDEGVELPAITATDAGAPGFTPVGVTVGAAAGEESVYVVDEAGKDVAQFSTSGTLLGQLSVAEPTPGKPQPFDEPLGVAVQEHPGPGEGDVYVSDGAGKAIDVFGPGFIAATVTTGAPSGQSPTGVTLNGSVNPGGVAVTSCVFEYGTSNSYGHSAPCEQSPGSGNVPVAVSAKLAGLQRDTTYHYRLLAENANGPSEGTDATFILGPELIDDSVTDVSDDSATFHANINPHSVSTSVYFQYGTSTAYGASAPAPPGVSLSPTESEVEVPVHVQDLSPSTVYHYRVVTVAGSEEFPGPDQTFTTQNPGGELTLPDGRQWELVSPPNKLGALIESFTESGSLVQAAAGGGAITYLTDAPTEPAAPGFSGQVQVLSTRGTGGWTSRDISPPEARVTGTVLATGKAYAFFTEDLSAAVVNSFGLVNPDLSGEASEQTPYLRTLGSCTDSCYRPLVTGKPGYENVPPGTHFDEKCAEEQVECGPRFRGATSDLSHVILVSPVPLSAGAPREELYEWSDGRLQLISILPENAAHEEPPAAQGTALFGRGRGYHAVKRHAISADGTRVFWEAATSGGSPETMYLRDTVLRRTLQLDRAEEVAGKPCEGCASGGGQFQIATANGESVLFTDKQRLTKDAGQAGFNDLYECRIVVSGGSPKCELTDLTPASGGESARVQGNVLGASEDDESVYFVAQGALSTTLNGRNEAAIPGKPNLYVRHGGATRFIATLAASDDYDWGEESSRPVRVSPDGQWLSFMSERSLTGYDNRDVVSGKPDAEVYLYNGATSTLGCASCNPSGARPHGVEYGKLVNGEGVTAGNGGGWKLDGWVAALAPENVNSQGGEVSHQGRYLYDSGRLFFNSVDALVPQDVNNNVDVYEYEPPGVPEGPHACSAASPAFSERSGGCVALISSGSSPTESGFFDASESGADAFFLSSAKLSPLDIDTARDVYDAHECSAVSPCLSQAVATPPCTTEASCRPSPAPQPQIFGAPASATFSGPGNVASPTVGAAKPLTRAQKLAHALRVCRKYKRKAKRAPCEKQAKKKYGPMSSAKNRK